MLNLIVKLKNISLLSPKKLTLIFFIQHKKIIIQGQKIVKIKS